MHLDKPSQRQEQIKEAMRLLHRPTETTASHRETEVSVEPEASTSSEERASVKFSETKPKSFGRIYAGLMGLSAVFCVTIAFLIKPHFDTADAAAQFPTASREFRAAGPWEPVDNVVPTSTLWPNDAAPYLAAAVDFSEIGPIPLHYPEHLQMLIDSGNLSEATEYVKSHQAALGLALRASGLGLHRTPLQGDPNYQAIAKVVKILCLRAELESKTDRNASLRDIEGARKIVKLFDEDRSVGGFYFQTNCDSFTLHAILDCAKNLSQTPTTVHDLLGILQRTAIHPDLVSAVRFTASEQVTDQLQKPQTSVHQAELTRLLQSWTRVSTCFKEVEDHPEALDLAFKGELERLEGSTPSSYVYIKSIFPHFTHLGKDLLTARTNLKNAELRLKSLKP